METSHPLFGNFTKLVRSKETARQAGLLVDAHVGRAQNANEAVAQSQGDLERSIKELPDLSDIERAAWISAIYNYGREPYEMEQSAEKLITQLTKLDEAFKSAGSPILLIRKVDSFNVRFEGFESSGQGLYFDAVEMNRGETEVKMAHDNLVKIRVNPLDINTVAASEEEIDAELINDIFTKDLPASHYGGLSYVIGQKTIEALATALIAGDVHRKTEVLLNFQKQAEDMGISLEPVSGYINQEKDKEREIVAKKAGLMIIEGIARDRANDALKVARELFEKQVLAPDVLVNEIQSAKDGFDKKVDEFLAELQKPADEQTAEPEESTEALA